MDAFLEILFFFYCTPVSVRLRFLSLKDYLVRIPPAWSVPELRTSGKARMRSSTEDSDEKSFEDKHDSVADSLSPSHSAEATIKARQTANQNRRRVENSSIALLNGSYVAVLTGLPGKTRIRIWLRVLNIQYCGPARYVLYLTQE